MGAFSFITKAFDSIIQRAVDKYFGSSAGAEIADALVDRWELDRPAEWKNDRLEQVKHLKGWVFAGIRVITHGVTSVPLRFYFVREDGTEEEAPFSHPIRELFRHVNEAKTFRDLMADTIVHMELTGDAYWSLSREDGAPTAIWSLLPQYTKIVPSKVKGGAVASYQFGKGRSKKVVYEPGNVLHYLYSNPDDLYYGFSPLQAAAEAVDADEGISHSQYRMFKVGLFPDQVIINIPQKLGRVQTKRLRRELQAAFGGREKAHRVFIEHSGISINRDTIKPREMDFRDSAVVTRREILGIYGVPEVLVGITGDANRASSKTAEYVFAKYTIKPKLDYIAGVITERLCPMFDPNLKAEFDNPVPADEEQREKQIRGQWNDGVLTLDEVRSELGYDPIGGDEGAKRKPQRAAAIQLAMPVLEEEVAKQEPIDAEVEGLMAAIWDREAEAKEFESVMTPNITDAMKQGAKLEETRLKKQVAEEFPEWIAALLERSRVRWDKTVGETTVKGLKATLAEALAANETGPQIAARVRKLFDETYAGRSTTIARTEIVSAANAGAEISGKAAGMEQKRWIATLDEVTRPTHMAADGQVVDIDETFKVGDANLRYPGDPQGPPKEIISCRCTLSSISGETKDYYGGVEKRFRAFEWKLERETEVDVRRYFREAGDRTAAKVLAFYKEEPSG